MILIVRDEPFQFFPKIWGYNDAEQQFLYLVATHSGCFFHHHYARFLCTSPNKRTTSLIRKALQHGHIRQEKYEQGRRKLYHIFSQKIYSQVGQYNANFRRPLRTDGAAFRLMITSFVMDRPFEAYLGCAEEQAEYFTQARGIPAQALPRRGFRNRRRDPLTVRYFTEKLPIFLEDESDPNSTVVFTFFDEHCAGQSRSIGGFRSFLKSYRKLFVGLRGNWKLIYVGKSAANFLQAEKTFQQSLSEELAQPSLGQMLHYFRLRAKFESVPPTPLIEPELSQWRDGLSRFAGRFFESLYQDWTRTHTIPDNLEADLLTSQPQFETHLVH